MLSVLLEQRVDNLLLLLHVRFVLFQAIALALDVDDGAVVKHPVKDSRSDGDIGKNLIPLRKGLVRGKDGGCLFISFGDKLKEKDGTLNIHRNRVSCSVKTARAACLPTGRLRGGFRLSGSFPNPLLGVPKPLFKIAKNIFKNPSPLLAETYTPAVIVAKGTSPFSSLPERG